MSVGLLLITHRPLAGDLLGIASQILGHVPLGVACCEVVNDTPPEVLIEQCQALAARLDQGEGILVLTDLYGSTPANVARALLDRLIRVRVVAGLNLPMLLRALNYADLELDALAAKALEGGRDGVRSCEPSP